MRRADVVVDARFAECDGFRLPLGEPAGRPLADRQCGRIVRDVADIAERYGGAGLDPGARRRKGVLGIAAADLDRIDTDGDRPNRTGDVRRWRRRPQRAELTFKREHPDGIAVGTALELIAAGRDRDVLLAIHLVDDGRRVGAKSGLEAEQLLAGPGI